MSMDPITAPRRQAPADAPPPTAAPARVARLGPEARRRIGWNLRLLYADVLEQPMPARLAGLLADLSGPDAAREPAR